MAAVVPSKEPAPATVGGFGGVLIVAMFVLFSSFALLKGHSLMLFITTIVGFHQDIWLSANNIAKQICRRHINGFYVEYVS